MTPMEACLCLGISNTFMVPVDWDLTRNIREPGVIDTFLKAYDAACQWLELHGDEEVPDENG